ncbi:hypothetical protein [Streptomyces sp. WG-D5]
MHTHHAAGGHDNADGHSDTPAARVTGRLLCWSVAAAMTTTALDAIAAAHLPTWWSSVWATLWLASPITAAAWAVARHQEKRRQQLARQTPDQDVPCPGTENYNTAA